MASRARWNAKLSDRLFEQLQDDNSFGASGREAESSDVFCDKLPGALILSAIGPNCLFVPFMDTDSDRHQ